MIADQASIVEVAPRDGFQSVKPFIPTEDKIALLTDLHAAGVRRCEVTSFASAAALPQLADASEVLSAAHALAGLDAQVLVPTARHAERALHAGARHLAFVLSVSEAHNRSNVRRSPAESAQEYQGVVAARAGGAPLRLNIATAFDCPFLGRVAAEATLQLLDGLVEREPRAEIALCDTTGRASPDQVTALFTAARHRYGDGPTWAFHAHDTYGLGAANALAAWGAGVRVFDASVAGLGGCPFAPGATGNIATEDLIWMFDGMGVSTGIDLERLLRAAHRVTRIDGAQIGGRVRDALTARAARSLPYPQSNGRSQPPPLPSQKGPGNS